MSSVNEQAKTQKRTEPQNPTVVADKRDLVVVSGYYGFENLGDEAILEELTNELKRLVKSENIVVLSANPKKTAELFGVQSVERTDVLGLMNLFKRSRLFISGGGGLFQNTRSLGSIIFYGFQIMLARTLGARVLVYAQGIGPLRGQLAEWITKTVFSAADCILVRDNGSQSLLESWGLQSSQTADPVWCLDSGQLPDAVQKQLDSIKTGNFVAVSLRTSHNFEDTHLQSLVESMAASIPPSMHLLLLPLQMNQDKELLERFGSLWNQRGRESTLVDTESMRYPSQWIALMSKCKMVVGMRLHALIMALKAGVPVVGIAYDPKVSHLLAEFEQPSLILTKEPQAQEWQQSLKTAFDNSTKLSRTAMKKAESAKKLACQNFTMLARIINM